MGCLTIDGAEIEPTGRAPLPCEGDAPWWPPAHEGSRFQKPTVLDQRYGATKQEQTSSNVIERHANHQILSAFPGRAHRS